MGAHDCIAVIVAKSEKEVRAQWTEMQENAAEEDGHGAYSGTCATMRGRPHLYDDKLANEDAARDFVLKRHDKWDPAVAVSFFLPAKIGNR